MKYTISGMKITRVSVKNFKNFLDTTISNIDDVALFVGKNGVGKSNFLSIFDFIQQCVRVGSLREVCVGENGVKNITHNGRLDIPTEIELTFKSKQYVTLRYVVKIAYDSGEPYVYEESLYTTQKSKAGAHTQIHIKNKKGKCTIDGNKCSLGKDELAIAVFGRLREHVAIAAMYRFVCGICTVNLAISNLYLETGAQNISYRGDNLRATALELQKTHPEHFQNVISHMQYAFDVEDISIIEEASGRLSIQFHTANEIIPDTLASDGMLSLFAYYLLLEQPLNQTLLCIEEPERNISHEIYTQLSEIIHIKASESNAQIYITTHSPQLISQFKSNEVFFLEKTARGDSKITHLKRDKILSELLKESSLGELYETNTLSAFTRA